MNKHRPYYGQGPQISWLLYFKDNHIGRAALSCVLYCLSICEFYSSHPCAIIHSLLLRQVYWSFKTKNGEKLKLVVPLHVSLVSVILGW